MPMRKYFIFIHTMNHYTVQVCYDKNWKIKLKLDYRWSSLYSGPCFLCYDTTAIFLFSWNSTCRPAYFNLPSGPVMSVTIVSKFCSTVQSLKRTFKAENITISKHGQKKTWLCLASHIRYSKPCIELNKFIVAYI